MTTSSPRGRRPGPTVRVSVRELTPAREVEHEDRLATEEPLEIRLAWPGVPAHRVWVTMRTDTRTVGPGRRPRGLLVVTPTP